MNFQVRLRSVDTIRYSFFLAHEQKITEHEEQLINKTPYILNKTEHLVIFVSFSSQSSTQIISFWVHFN